MKKAFIQLHIAVFLAGFTGILGKLITLNEGLLVWYRLLISAVTLWILFFIGKRNFIIPRKDALKIGLSFYGCIKIANVSIALVCFSAIGFFTALIEPMIFRVKIDWSELALGLLVIIGISFIFHFDPHYQTGIWVGLIAALLGSIFPILSRKLLQRISFEMVTLYELSGGFIFLSLLLPFYLAIFPTQHILPGLMDWIWLLVLSWLCTVVAMNFSMSALRKISAFTVNLTYNLEPIYGIALAFAVFREDQYLSRGFYIGLGLILLAIVLQMIRLKMKTRRAY
jgi:drug/metabolite transporter (DMT)-like permease